MMKAFLGFKLVAAVLIGLTLMTGTATAQRKHKPKHGRGHPIVHRHMKHMKHRKHMKM